jgi:hypothetical protein
MEIIDFDAARLGPFLIRQIELFLIDPPDSDFQCGYLAALIIVYREGLGREAPDGLLQAAERLYK